MNPLTVPSCLFSAYAEVFPVRCLVSVIVRAFLCLRRGVSTLPKAVHLIYKLFSAYAEVFRADPAVMRGGITFLCLRRGVSDNPSRDKNVLGFSLPTQRCFFIVFPREDALRAFLCLRRGVSHSPAFGAISCCFSLPTQRCFRLRSTSATDCELFSAYAEVFLIPAASGALAEAFLCLRRGVSHSGETRSWRI